MNLLDIRYFIFLLKNLFFCYTHEISFLFAKFEIIVRSKPQVKIETLTMWVGGQCNLQNLIFESLGGRGGGQKFKDTLTLKSFN